MNDLAAIIDLMAQSPLHRNYRAATMKRILLPCIEYELYRVAYGEWFCTFAYWDTTQINQFMNEQTIDGDWTDRPNTILWVIDFVTAAHVNRRQVVNHLIRDRLWQETDRDGIAFARSYGTGRFQRIGKIRKAA